MCVCVCVRVMLLSCRFLASHLLLHSLARTTIYVVQRTPYIFLEDDPGPMKYTAAQCKHHHTVCFACFVYTVYSVVVRNGHMSRGYQVLGATKSPKPTFQNYSPGRVGLGKASEYVGSEPP